MAVTARLALRYPVLSDSADVPRDIQNLANDIDGKVPIDTQGTLAARPTTSLISGQYYFATDNGLLYRYNGSAWITINAAGLVDQAAGTGSLRTLGTGALQAAAGNDSRFTSLALVDQAAGVGSLRTIGTGALQAMAGNDSRVDQPGDLKLTAAITLQTGYLECDGASYLRASFAALFAALGGASSTWGLPDGTHFNVPDFRGRSPMGAGTGSGLTNRVFGTTAGEENHVLTVAELASHNHGGITGDDSPDHVHQVLGTTGTPGGANLPIITGSYVNNFNSTTGGASARHQHSITNQGGGGGHNTVHPVAIVHFQIKT